jgi:hypothetical protein
MAPKRRGRRSKKSQKGSQSVSKGRLVEQIAAKLHQWQGVDVQTNVKITLPGKKRKPEIDVLLIGNFAGYPIRIPIECKNEKDPIGVEKMDAFIGKLQSANIPVQQGIYISASGYTRDALEGAEEVGIRPLILTGLTQDRLSAAVTEAFQSVIYLLGNFIGMRVPDHVKGGFSFQEISIFFDKEGTACGYIPDPVHRMWVAGTIPTTIGEHEIPLILPEGWYHRIKGVIQPPIPLIIKVRVSGVVLTVKGKATQHILINASSKTPERGQFNVSFDIQDGVYPITNIHSEDELSSYIEKSGLLRVTIGRIPLPRIRFQWMYWPPSERTVRLTYGIWRAMLAGEIADIDPLSLADIEGTDLSAIWEPVWEEHPSVKKKNKL